MMKAADTNVLVRLIAGEPDGQFFSARNFFDSSEVFVPVTVVLETEWVLRRVLKLPKPAALRALTAAFGLHTVVVEQAHRVALALDWAEQGMDFADALHLASAEACVELVTFDQKLISRARRLGLSPEVVEP